MRDSVAHPLKVDEVSPPVASHDVLRLEIAMDEDARQGGQQLGNFAKPPAIRLGEERGIGFEIALGAVFEEVVLLPPVEVGIERVLEPGTRAIGARSRVQANDLFEGAVVQRAADGPRFVPEMPEIDFAQVFHPDQALVTVVVVNRGHAHAETVQKGGDVAIVAVFFPLIPSIVCQWSKIPPPLQTDAVHTLFAAGLGTPFLVMTACLVGVLEAHQKFKLINIIRLPMQIYTFLGPLGVALISHSLLAPVVALLAGKAVECGFYFVACLWDVPVLRRGVHLQPSRGSGLASQRTLVRQLFALGGWMSVSSIAMLVLNQVNSVLMFGLLPVAMVGFYATIAEMIIRLLIFPRAWVSVLFPSFSAQHALDSGAVAALYAKGVKSLLLFSFPVALVLFAFACEGLTLWQDRAFAETSAGVMRWLTAGVFVYGLSFVPFSLLQGVGRPDISAKLHLVEIPVTIVLAWSLMKPFGMAGAGAAWFIRCVFEAVVMALLAQRYAPGSGRAMARVAVVTGVGLLLMGGMTVIPSFAGRLMAFPVTVLLFSALGWSWLLGADEREALVGMIGRGRS